MKPNYQIIDNFLPKEDFTSLLQIMGIEGDGMFPWYYIKSVDDSTKPELIDHLYFIHLFFLGAEILSTSYQDVLPLVKKINPKALIRIKANAYPKNGNDIIYHRQHTDYTYEHKGAIFYLNTNNGFTVLEDGTKISSVANRILFFNPSRPHNSTNSTDVKMRYNINFNYF